MKKPVFAAALCFCLCLMLCGCSLFAKNYSYSEDYMDTDAYILTSGTEVRSAEQLESIILEMVASGTKDKDLSFLNYEGSVNEDLALACTDVRYNTAIGCYALSNLTFETSRIVSYYIATVHADYSVSAEQLSGIQTVSGSIALQDQLQKMYDSGGGELVLSVEHAIVSEESIQEAMHSCFLKAPLNYIHEPEVQVQSYTVSTVGGIFDISLSGDFTRTEIVADATAIRQLITGALPKDTDQMEITPDVLLSLARNLKDSLGEISFDDSRSISLSDVLSPDAALDSKTAALLFGVMCSQLGIDSLVVEGYGSSLEEQEHTWNMVCLDGTWYHADFSMLDETGSQHFLVGDDTMWNYCSWDTGNYPACPEDYAFVQPAAAPQEEAAEQEPPAATEAPVETSEQPG